MDSDAGQREPWWVGVERNREDDSSFEALADRQEAIETREDLASFIQALCNDLHAHPTWWENNTLDSYLDALAAATESLDQGFKNLGETLPEQPTWKLVGDLLLTARIYE